ncbi:hypothetical protein CVT25_002173 [Psilocybe cyanescens]|uniref:Uncharacterized protein n=1 Tax=Psilocybe cyanescens TaxID=93625 RepID=A0A409WZY6_PSICY|nr:hypothetical protein CVT25_002173 [Psilocybe cyanescens]
MHILKNHPSCLDYPDKVSDYLLEEVSAGCMSGPFSKEAVEQILRGPFQSSPLIVAVQPQGPGEPDKICICRNLSKATKGVPSVNSFISKSDFPLVLIAPRGSWIFVIQSAHMGPCQP